MGCEPYGEQLPELLKGHLRQVNRASGFISADGGSAVDEVGLRDLVGGAGAFGLLASNGLACSVGLVSPLSPLSLCSLVSLFSSFDSVILMGPLLWRVLRPEFFVLVR